MRHRLIAAFICILTIVSGITLLVERHRSNKLRSPSLTGMSPDRSSIRISRRKNSLSTPHLTRPTWAPIRKKPTGSIPEWLPIIAAAIILLIVGKLTKQIFICWDLQSEIFLRLAAAVILFWGAFATYKRLRTSTAAPANEWWNLGSALDAPSWDDVRRMTLGDWCDDPLVYEAKPNYLKRLAKAVFANVILGAALIEAISFLVAGPIVPRLLTPAPSSDLPLPDLPPHLKTISLDLNANLTALLALIAAFVSIYFTYLQLQAKVKADSRQAWLNKLRGEISSFIALSDAIHYGAKEDKRGAMRSKLTASRLEMELMLNPSEKDHRLLMFLSIKLAFFDADDEAFEGVHDVRNVRHAIETDPRGYNENNWAKLLGPIPNRSLMPQLHDDEYGDLIGYVMRLSHVVLKREWQRVKNTR